MIGEKEIAFGPMRQLEKGDCFFLLPPCEVRWDSKQVSEDVSEGHGRRRAACLPCAHGDEGVEDVCSGLIELVGMRRPCLDIPLTPLADEGCKVCELHPSIGAALAEALVLFVPIRNCLLQDLWSLDTSALSPGRHFLATTLRTC